MGRIDFIANTKPANEARRLNTSVAVSTSLYLLLLLPDLIFVVVFTLVAVLDSVCTRHFRLVRCETPADARDQRPTTRRCRSISRSQRASGRDSVTSRGSDILKNFRSAGISARSTSVCGSTRGVAILCDVERCVAVVSPGVRAGSTRRCRRSYLSKYLNRKLWQRLQCLHTYPQAVTLHQPHRQDFHRSTRRGSCLVEFGVDVAGPRVP